MGRSSKISQIPKFVNKTQEVYQYIVDHSGSDERQISKGLSHLTAPVIHASLRMLHDGGYVTKTDTEETNKIGRKICQYHLVKSKKYEPTYTRRPGAIRSVTSKGKSASAPPSTHQTVTATKSDQKKLLSQHTSLFDSEMKLTLPTKEGPVILSLSDAQGIYSELKKLFGDR